MRPRWLSILIWLLIIIGTPWLVWVVVQEARRKQVWEVLIQTPGGSPIPPWEVPIRYERREDCEAFRTHFIQTELKERRPPTPLVYQGRYAWWELILRPSPKDHQGPKRYTPGGFRIVE
jgi:hypothetical protein